MRATVPGMTTDYGDPGYAARAIAALQGDALPKRLSDDQRVTKLGIDAVTYALLDLAAAIREHGSR